MKTTTKSAKSTIWMVEMGSYSDYHVVGIFTSRAKAQLVADVLNQNDSYDNATVAEYPLNPAVDELRKGYSCWFVLMLRDGTVEQCTLWNINSSSLAGSVWLWRRTQASAYQGKGIPDALKAEVWAKDAKHAIKIVNEHRTRMIAQGEWA